MNPPFVLLIILALLASVAGGVFILKQEKEIVIENYKTGEPFSTTSEVNDATTSEVNAENGSPDIDEATLISQAQILISETQKFIDQQKEQLALIGKAQEKSGKIKGIYIGAGKSANAFKQLLADTELNSLVIDIKETYGQNLPLSFKSLISEFHEQDGSTSSPRGVWIIARIAVFRDSSLIKEKSGWYLASTTDTTSTDPWRDNAGQYWLDPQNSEVHDYIIEFSKKAIDYGFDELQFDYIRYPDDYEYVSGQEKIKAMGDFFAKLSKELRDYKPSIILSVDLFGYVATQFNSYGTGQRLIDAGKYFDYLSFMLYPSHFYGGFSVPEDAKRQISAAYFPYNDDNTTTTGHLVSNNPYEVVLRSIFSSFDYLDFYGIKAKIRPWLQDFDLKADKDRGIFYDAQKVRSEITAAEDAGSSGWLLWNPSYAYTKEALKE